MTNEERDALIAQGWTPPAPVDSDIAEALQIYHNSLFSDPIGMTLIGIKRGRELERAEAKPKGPQTAALQAGSAGYRDWHDITHHAIIAPPAEDVA